MVARSRTHVARPRAHEFTHIEHLATFGDIREQPFGRGPRRVSLRASFAKLPYISANGPTRRLFAGQQNGRNWGNPDGIGRWDKCPRWHDGETLWDQR